MQLNGTKRMVAAMVCGLLMSAAPVFAQDNQSAPAPPPPAQGDQQPGPDGPGGGPHHGRGQMDERRIEHMTKVLNLTPDQVTQVKAIDASEHDQMRAMHQDTATAPADKRAKMMAIHQDSTAKIRALLNSDQQTKFDAMQAKMKERREERHGEQGPPPPPAAQ